MQTKIADIAIIGGGASGIMAAICASKVKVVLIEHKDKIAKKLLATGNGKCNYTNQDMKTEFFYGDLSLINGVLDRFSVKDTLLFFRRIGILPVCHNGYYYPLSEQAASLVTALCLELQKQHTEIYTNTVVSAIHKEKNGFSIVTEGITFHAKKIIIATGLLASPRLGSDGTFFPIIRELGHHFTEISPVLCGFQAEGMDFPKVAGVRCRGGLSVYLNRHFEKKEAGEIQFTDYGISGIPVFQLSHCMNSGLFDHKKVMVSLDLVTDLSECELREELLWRGKNLTDRSPVEMLNGILPQKLLPEILRKAKQDTHQQHLRQAKQGTDPDVKIPQRTKQSEDLEMLVKLMKSFPLTILKSRGFEYAQVCSGGIRSEEIHSNTLESKLVPGTYFCGEILNVDGICGGYNLQWAWSSGYVAASSAVQSLEKRGNWNWKGKA